MNPAGKLGVAPTPPWRDRARRLLAAITIVAGGFLASGATLPPPRISISFNNSQSADVYRGMPLLITITFVHPDPLNPQAPAMILAAQSGPWTNAFHLNISDANGKPVSWPLHDTIHPGGSVVLDAGHYARVDYWLGPTETPGLANGSHTLTVTLDTTAATVADAWKGKAGSLPIDLEIRDEPAPLSKAQAEYKYGQLASYRLFQHDAAGALQDLETLLAGFPGSVAGLRLKAEALNSAGRIQDARKTIRQALAQARTATPDAQEAPFNLMRLERDLDAGAPVPEVHAAQAGGTVTLSWTGTAGESYRLESSLDLKSWSTLSTDFTVVGNEYSFTVEPTLERRFFRIAR